jgi:phosphatidylinositol alpha-1,6-mannosyltransferase
MRVLLVTPVFPPAHGGIELLSQRLAEHMPSCDIAVVTLEEPGWADHDRRMAIPIRRVRNQPRGGRRAILRLNRAAVRAACSARPDAVLSMHVRAAPAAYLLQRFLGVPYVQYVHAREIAVWPRLAHFAVTRARRTIAVSSYAVGLARQVGAPERRIRQIPPGVDATQLANGGRGRSRDVLLTVSRIEQEDKGHDVVLAALPAVRRQVPTARWVVIGDGTLRSELEQRAAVMGLGGAVSFLGSVSDAERDRWLDTAAAFVMPSRIPPDRKGGEGFGIVYLEAAAHGLPVVTGNAGGAADAVAHEVTGLLVDPTDAAAVADAITRLLTDAELSARLGRASVARAQEFAWPAVAERVRTVLAEAVGESSGRHPTAPC